MKKMIIAVMFALLFVAPMATSYAESWEWHGGIRLRIEEAQQRIARGIERGSLTRNEAWRLQRELGNILNEINGMRQDDGRRQDH